MSIQRFQELYEQPIFPRKMALGIVNAYDRATLESVFDEQVRKHIFPLLIGGEAELRQVLQELNFTDYDYQLIGVTSADEAAKVGAELAKSGEIDLLMKGHIDSRTFLKAIVARENNLIKDSLLSHVAVNDLPNYHKLLITTDGGMVTEPTYEEKRLLLANSLLVAKGLGISKPKVGILAATEIVNPKINSSVEAEKLMKQVSQNEPDTCCIAGPISLDLALSREIANLKGYTNPVAGDVDILIGPDITAMNLLGKSMTVLAQGKMAGLIIGAKIPIVMSSRGSAKKEKIASILLAACVSNGG